MRSIEALVVRRTPSRFGAALAFPVASVVPRDVEGRQPILAPDVAHDRSANGVPRKPRRRNVIGDRVQAGKCPTQEAQAPSREYTRRMRGRTWWVGASLVLACGGSTSSGGDMSDAAVDGGGGAGGGGGSSGAGGGSLCTMACTMGFTCCGGKCVNPNNDIANCGGCGNRCTGAHPFCNGGQCGTPPCTATGCAGTTFCCGEQCCAEGQLCCDVPGPVERGPACTAPVGGTCPVGCPLCICASPDTPVATPRGNVPIASIQVGDVVFSVDRGVMVAVIVQEIVRVPAKNHSVRRVHLATGETLEISSPHPTADGRTFGDLRAGNSLDGVAIREVETVPYAHPFTYDILPASDSGTYFAGGVLVGSTLAHRATLV